MSVLDSSGGSLPGRSLDDGSGTAFSSTFAAREAIAALPPDRRQKSSIRSICQLARAHSANMAKQEKMAHELDGKNPADRIKAAGYDYSYIAENIAVSDGESPEGIVKAWMDSKIHKENILNDKYTEIGIGVAKNDKGETYYTQEFGTPRKKK